MEETLAIFFGGVYSLVAAMILQYFVIPKGRLKFLNRKLKKLQQASGKGAFFAFADKLVRGKKRHFLGLRFFVPVGVNLGLAKYLESGWPIVLGAIMLLVQLIVARKRNKDSKKGNVPPWGLKPSSVERMALKVLIDSKDPEMREQLRDYIYDEDDSVSQYTVEELILIRKPWTVPILSGEEEGQSPDTLLLAKLTTPNPQLSVQDLKEKLNSPRPGVRATWLPLALRLPNKDRDRYLLANVHHTDTKVQQVAKDLTWLINAHKLVLDLRAAQSAQSDQQLRQLLERVAVALENADYEDYLVIAATAQAWKHDPTKLSTLLKHFQKLNDPILAAARTLTEVRSPDAMEALFHLLAHTEEKVIQTAFEVLEAKPDMTPAHIEARLETSNPKIQMTLPELTNRFPYPEIAPLMEHFLDSQDHRLRFAAVKALDHWHDTEAALDQMSTVSHDLSWDVRYLLYRNLEKNGSMQALELLMDARTHYYHDSGLGLRHEIDPEEISQLENIIHGILKKIGGKKQLRKLFCTDCLTRSTPQKSRGITYPHCRKCKKPRYLINHIKEVRGILGPDAHTGIQQPGTFEVDLWDAGGQKTTYADIDVLEIKGGGNFSYDWAVSSALEVLQNGSPQDPWQVKLVFSHDPLLEANTKRLLKEVEIS